MASDNFQIQNGLDNMLETALTATFKDLGSQTEWSMRREQTLDAVKQSNCIILTISSFRFRVMCILHLNLDDKIKSFLADAYNTKVNEITEDKLVDYLLELSNSFCGHVKRYLQDTCPPLGMSTPNLMDSDTLVFDKILDVHHEAHISSCEYKGSPAFISATALVSQLDDSGFNVPLYQATNDGGGEMESFGELEMF